MNLKDKMNRELDRLASLIGSASPAVELKFTTADHDRIECLLSGIDKIACAFEHFTLKTDKLADASLEELKSLSENLSSRLTYLLEPISPIEFDPDGCVVQMRSNPPQKDEQEISYYELLVKRGGQLALRRHRKVASDSRVDVSANVTREVLQRLASDFSAAVN